MQYNCNYTPFRERPQGGLLTAFRPRLPLTPAHDLGRDVLADESAAQSLVVGREFALLAGLRLCARRRLLINKLPTQPALLTAPFLATEGRSPGK